MLGSANDLYLSLCFCCQERAASSLSLLVQRCVTRETSPNAKIIKNLCSLLCCDPQYTPVISQDSSEQPTKSVQGKLCHLCECYSVFTSVLVTSFRQAGMIVVWFNCIHFNRL